MKSFIPFLLLFFLLILPTQSIYNFTHFESENPSLSKTNARIQTMVAYSDGTVVIRIFRRNITATARLAAKNLTFSGQLCSDPFLSIRTIYPNGSLLEANVDLGVQEINYCIFTIGTNPDYLIPIKIFAIRDGLLYVTYVNSTTEETNFETYNDHAVIIDLTGKIYTRIYHSPTYIDPLNDNWIPTNVEIVNNINPSKGFLRFGPQSRSYNLEWQQLIVDESGVITQLSRDVFVIEYNGRNFEDTPVITASATVGGGYAIVYANTTTPSTTDNSLKPLGGVYSIFLSYKQQNTGSAAVLFQTQLPVKLTRLHCDVEFVGVGQVCVVVVNSTSGIYYVKINFLSSGSVTGYETLNIANANNPGISTLFFGGYFLSATGGARSMLGYIYGNDTMYSWDLPEPHPTGWFSSRVILRNNTLLIGQAEEIDYWSLTCVDLYRFVDLDSGYENFKVDTTVPARLANIQSTQKQILINFYEPVELSIGYVIIYESDKIIRQRIQGTNPNYVTLSEDAKSVKIEVIDCAFNRPGRTYTVEMEPNFVQSKKFKEALTGIRKDVWSFKTDSIQEKKGISAQGRVRLNYDGSEHFLGLDDTQKSEFILKLSQEIADAIPVDRNRIRSNGRSQIDATVSPQKLILLSIDIESVDDHNEIPTHLAIRNLDTLVKNKDITSLQDLNKTSRFLDENYGYESTPNIWEQNRYKLIGIPIGAAIFVSFFLLSQRRSQDSVRPANNIAIFQLGLIIFDFIIDVLFASTKAREIEELYIPTVVILVVSLTINLMLAFYIISNENSRNPIFAKWASTRMKVISTFTLIASADIEALIVLQSNLADFDFFKAEFSENALSKIFWGACLNIFIEDLPQVIIQILYFTHVVYNDIIPLLSLCSSCLTLAVNIIGRLYQTIEYCREKNDKNKITIAYTPPANRPDSTDDFGGLGGGGVAAAISNVQNSQSKHPLQFNPEDHNRDVKSLDQGKIGHDGDIGKVDIGKVAPEVVPELVVDSQKVDLDNEEVIDHKQMRKRSSKSSFKEII